MGGAAIAKEVLGTGRNVTARKSTIDELVWFTLQASHHRVGELRDQRGILRVTLIDTSPVQITGYRDGRGVCPVHADRRSLLRRRLADAANQRCIVRGPETNVVRENDGALQTVVAMDG